MNAGFYNLIRIVYYSITIMNTLHAEASSDSNLSSSSDNLNFIVIYRDINIFFRVYINEYFYFNIKIYKDYFIKFF
jgi:hypothetical protein